MSEQNQKDVELGVVVAEEPSSSKKSSLEDKEDLEEQEALTTELRKVRVVAPINMPPGYRLEVKAKGETFFVRVPKKNGGVAAGEKFEAEEIPMKPVKNGWSDDVLSCAPSYEGNFCFLAFFCPNMAMSVIMQSLGLDWTGRPSGASYMINFMFAILAAYSVAYTVGWIWVTRLIVLYLIVLRVLARGAFREKYRIPGSSVDDCFWTFCCTCCASLQMYRHMKRSGEEPTCCKSRPTGAVIV